MSKPHITAMANACEQLRAIPGVKLQKVPQAGRLLVMKAGRKIDLWPTTGNWRVRVHGLDAPQGATNKGLPELIAHLTQEQS